MKNFFDFFKPASPSTLLDEGSLFKKCLKERLLELEKNEQSTSQFVRRHLSEESLEQLANMARRAMEQSLADGKMHFELLAKPPVCYVVMSSKKAKASFNRQQGGFGNLLESLVNEPLAEGCEVFCLAIFGREGEEYWMDLKVFFRTDEGLSKEIRA